MKKLPIALAFIALLVAGSGVALYETSGDPQHRNPAQPAQPAQQAQSAQAQQPAQPQAQPQQPKDARQAPPATPKAGRRAPSTAPRAGRAVPRSPEARTEQRRPPRGRERVVVPYWGPWWGYPYPYGYWPYDGWRTYAEWEFSDVRLDVKPEDAQVYVDGYFTGVVDDFNGVFQRLTLRPGPHLIEIRKIGYKSLATEVNLYPGQTVTYRRNMERSAGEPSAPAPAPLPPGFEEGAAPPLPDVDLPPGNVRFDVTPKDAAVYADGFYAGIVDDFNGSQHLQLAPGRHHVTLRMDGYETIEVDLSVESARDITYRATMKKVS